MIQDKNSRPAAATPPVGPYAAAAEAIFESGWSPLPLPPGQKGPPPKGCTGHAAKPPSYADVHAWITGPEAAGNVGVRLDGHTLGLDTDHYGDKRGGDTIATFEAEYGPLPATWKLTSRTDGVSGIRLYGVPEGRSWRSPGPHVDVIQRDHRYAVAPPSIHPSTGAAYRLIGPDGEVTETWPRPEDLPPLPDAWVVALSTPAGAESAHGEPLSLPAAVAWLADLPGADATPDVAMAAEPVKAMEPPPVGPRYDWARNRQLAMVRLGERGHPGLLDALADHRADYVCKVAPERAGGAKAAGDEWDRALGGACAKVQLDPSECSPPLLHSMQRQVDERMARAAADGAAAVTIVPNANGHAGGLALPMGNSDRLTPGGTFILDAPDHVPARWGAGQCVVWAEGEALCIVGPPGVGKTTVCGQLAGGLVGLFPTVLGMPVRPARPVLYLAMDRPRQIARALRRTLGRAGREHLNERLIVWEGPPPSDVAQHPEVLLELARKANADVVIIDSLKDAALGLTDDEVGAGYNRARQHCLANGIDVLELHHTVKRGPNGAKPTTLADVYGSTWITAGAGSVVLLWGAAGDPIVELVHLKQPAEPFGPCKIIHDHAAGTSAVWEGTDLEAVARAAGVKGITAKHAATVLFSTDKPSPAEVEKARRKLDGLPALTRTDGSKATSTPAVWTITHPSRSGFSRDGITHLTTITSGRVFAGQRPSRTITGPSRGPPFTNATPLI